MQFPNSAYSGYSSFNTTARQLLKLAEKRYGECVKPIKISVKEWDADHPETSFDPSFTQATIKIQKTDENQRRYQLAQEVVQCLSPVPPEQLTFFDKGLAQMFALSVGVKITPPEDNEIQKNTLKVANFANCWRRRAGRILFSGYAKNRSISRGLRRTT